MDFDKQFRSSRNIFNLPNTLSIFRILLVPVVAVFLAYDTEQPLFRFDYTFRYSAGRMATLVVVLAGVTDILDGYFARRWRIVSLFGKFLDPLADKLFLMVSLLMLMELDRVRVWLVIALLSRELFVTGLRTVAVGEGIVIPADQGGKLKTIFQLVGIGFLCWQGSFLTLHAHVVGTYILYIALVISLISGYRYIRSFLIALAEKRDAGGSDAPSRQALK